MQRVKRVAIYVLGMAVLSLGLSLSNRTGWGNAPMISIAAAVAQLSGITFGMASTGLYLVLVGGQFCLRGRRSSPLDLFQLPVSLALGFLLDFFGARIHLPPGFSLLKVGALALGLVCTGIGASTTLNMRLAPSPADGFVQAVADVTGRSRGLCKNIIDGICASATLAAGLLLTGGLVGVGVGTLCSVLIVGRVMAIFDRFTKEKMCAAAGVGPRAQAPAVSPDAEEAVP